MKSASAQIAKAVKTFGSQAKLAQAAGVVQGTVQKALSSGRVGVRLAQGIDAATRGEVSKSSLRPDIWPPA